MFNMAETDLPQEVINAINEQIEMVAQAFDSLTEESFKTISMMLCKQAFKRGETYALRQVKEMIQEQKEMIK
jgi:precorrin-3B methylase